jgi:hypothetical protein
MMNSCELEQAERHTYISGDTKRAALLAEIIDLRHEVDNLQYRLDEEDDDSTD